MSERNWHHYFHGAGIDMAKVHDEANNFMSDYKSPRSSIVHDHAHEEPCENKHHTVYDQVTRMSFPLEYNEEARHAFAEIVQALSTDEVTNGEPMGNGLRREKS